MPPKKKHYTGKSRETPRALSEGTSAFNLKLVAKVMKMLRISDFGLKLSLPRNGIGNLTLLS